MIAVLENPEIRNRVPPLSVQGYHLLRDWGAVSIKSELINGVVVVEKVSKSPLHEYLVETLEDWLRGIVPPGYRVRKKGPLTLADSEPEPDISVVQGTPRAFKTGHPASAALVVELSSLALDREKAAIYAGAGIPVYWLILAETQQVEVYTEPHGNAYRHKAVLGKEERLVTPFEAEVELAALFE